MVVNACEPLYESVYTLWRRDPLLANGSVNTFAIYVQATIGRPSIGNGEVNTPGILGNGVFDVIRAEML
jgi:hypothetical protein